MIGETVGKYKLISQLGEGGMGVVYKAEHLALGRFAAIKKLQPGLSADPEIVQRFFNEAKAASAIDHPGIVEIFDYGTQENGQAYIVMPFLQGETLETRLERGPLPLQELYNVMEQVISALGAAHERGIIHRDLKPENIFLQNNEMMPGGIQVKLLDFGIAKLAGPSAGNKTKTGTMMGTPAYMSPEQCRGAADIDHRTDLYALGCILFHIACGRPPFLSDQGTGVLIAAQIRDQPPHPQTFNPGLPNALVTIIGTLLQKDPAQRYESAGALKDALKKATRGQMPSYEPMALSDTFAALPMVSTPGPAPSPTEYPTPNSTVRPAKKKSGWLWGLLVTLLGVGGAVGALMFKQGNATPNTVVDANTETVSANVDAAIFEKPATAPASGTSTETLLPCEEGQIRTVDSRGNCCWPEQVWSMSKSKCIGKPKCPEGMLRRGTECKPKKPTEPSSLTEKTPRVARFRLSTSTFPPNSEINIRFNRPVTHLKGTRSWVTVVRADAKDSSYDRWKYVPEGAQQVVLKSHPQEGNYEVRYHTDYPKKRTNVVQRKAFRVEVESPGDGSTPKKYWQFSLNKKVVRQGGNVVAKFPRALKASPGEKFWITILKKSLPDTTYGNWSYVKPGARSHTLRAPSSSGEYEVRLHANYPKKSINVVARKSLTIE